jgi:hypothetical protein
MKLIFILLREKLSNFKIYLSGLVSFWFDWIDDEDDIDVGGEVRTFRLDVDAALEAEDCSFSQTTSDATLIG